MSATIAGDEEIADTIWAQAVSYRPFSAPLFMRKKAAAIIAAHRSAIEAAIREKIACMVEHPMENWTEPKELADAIRAGGGR